jgi:alanine racemase
VVQTRQVADALAEAGVAVRYVHIANSGALIQFPDEVSWDLVRPGVAMYGMYPSDEVPKVGLRPVMRLESSLVKVTRYDRKWTVGYGRSWDVGPGSVIGIVPIGYGDGFPRLLSSRGSALVHGVRVPIAGRVSMDMIALDLTDLPEAPQVDDEVVLLGRQEWFSPDARTEARSDEIDALELAELCNTITYEITCGFTIRVPRLYVRDGQVVAIQSMREGYRVL